MHLKEYRHATEITALFMFCIYLFHPILAPYIKSIGFSDFQIGLLFALFPLTLIVSAANFGVLSDSIGRKKIMILGIIFEIVGIVFYLVGIWYLIIIARFLEALAFAAVVFVGLARVQDNIESKSRGKYSGIALTTIQLSKLFAPVMGGFLADYLFTKAPFLLAAVSLLLTLWIVALHESLNMNHRFTRSDLNFAEKIRAFFSYRGLKGMGILGIVMHASVPVTYVFMPIYIVEHFGLTYSFVGYAIFAMEVFMVFQFLIGPLNDRFSKAKLTLFGACTFGVSMLLLSWAPNYWSFVAVLLLAGFGLAFWNVSAWSFMADIGAGIRKEGFVMGTYISVAKIGDFVSTLAGGLVVQMLGVKYLMFSVGTIILLGAVSASFFMLSRPEHKTVKAG